jgi:hypothetical protein
MLGWIILGAFIAWNVSLTVWLSILTAEVEANHVETDRRLEARSVDLFVRMRELELELEDVKEALARDA